LLDEGHARLARLRLDGVGVGLDELALLHEGDLLNFLADLRESGNAYYSIKHCSLSRTGAAPVTAGLAPRLRAECEIDLITIVDRAAKA